MSHTRDAQVPASAGAPLGKDEFRATMGHYATGAAIVTAAWQDQPYGLAVNSFTSVSLDPPKVLFCPDKSSDTWPMIRKAGRFAVNVLACGQSDTCRTFAKKGADRFIATRFTSGPRTGSPILSGVLAHLECELERVVDAGDHYVALGAVVDGQAYSGQSPLLFYRGQFHELGASP